MGNAIQVARPHCPACPFSMLSSVFAGVITLSTVVIQPIMVVTDQTNAFLHLLHSVSLKITEARFLRQEFLKSVWLSSLVFAAAGSPNIYLPSLSAASWILEGFWKCFLRQIARDLLNRLFDSSYNLSYFLWWLLVHLFGFKAYMSNVYVCSQWYNIKNVNTICLFWDVWIVVPVQSEWYLQQRPINTPRIYDNLPSSPADWKTESNTWHQTLQHSVTNFKRSELKKKSYVAFCTGRMRFRTVQFIIQVYIFFVIMYACCSLIWKCDWYLWYYKFSFY